MNPKIRPLVTFKSTAFNFTEHKSYFINECCFGDEVAEWLLAELRKLGVQTDDKPGQEDFGWYLNFELGGVSYCFVVLYRSDDVREGATWIGELERNCGFVGSIFGRRKHGLNPSAAETIHRILQSSPAIRDVRWHLRGDFDTGDERGAESPSAPF
jgi:hypothetical protein